MGRGMCGFANPADVVVDFPAIPVRQFSDLGLSALKPAAPRRPECSRSLLTPTLLHQQISECFEALSRPAPRLKTFLRFRGMWIALCLSEEKHFLLIKGRIVMSTDQQGVRAAQEAARTAPRPTGAGPAGSVAYVI